MGSEASRGSSIPTDGVSVKALLVEAVRDAPVHVHEYGLSVSVEATARERVDLICRLVDGESRVIVPFRLCIGDVWQQTPPRSQARREFALSLRTRLGENYYDLVRRYGWVAGMWPQHLRVGGHPWAYYLRGPKGCAKKSAAKDVVHECVRREAVDGAELLHCERGDGTTYRLRIIEKTSDVNAGGTEGDGGQHDPGLGAS